MITIDIVGGLGNQLFKIFTTIAYSLEYNKPFFFEYKEFILNRHTYWNSFLRRLKIFTTALNHNKEHYFNALRKNNVIIHNEHKTYEYIEIPNYLDKTVFLKGYFQSYRYFEKYKEKIFNIIGIEKYQEEIKNQFIHYFDHDSVTISMHFRLGDYKNLPNFHPIIPISYYEKSILDISIKLGKQTKYKILYFCEEEDNTIVSDYIKTIKQNIYMDNIEFIKVDDTIDDWIQVIIMSICQHNIIANSTFSWWGAYFGNTQNRLIYYPDIWFGPALQQLQTSQMFPITWQKIDCI